MEDCKKIVGYSVHQLMPCTTNLGLGDGRNNATTGILTSEYRNEFVNSKEGRALYGDEE